MKKIKSGYVLHAFENNDFSSKWLCGPFKSSVEAVGVAKRMIRETIPKKNSEGHLSWVLYGTSVSIDGFGEAPKVTFCSSSYAREYCGLKVME